MKKFILSALVILTLIASCNDCTNCNSSKTYTVEIRFYSGRTDTTITDGKPYLGTTYGRGVLYEDRSWNPIATDVESYKILSIK